MVRRFCIGDLLIKINYLALIVLLMKLINYAVLYLEHTKMYKIYSTALIAVTILQFLLYCIKCDK